MPRGLIGLALVVLPACVSGSDASSVAGRSSSQSTSQSSASATPYAAGNANNAQGPAFVACSGKVSDNGATSTDMNPPTWTWSRCDVASPQYRISLDDTNAVPTVTSTTTYTPTSALHVGEHTLYVSQQKSDGSWSDVAALSMTLMPRSQQGNVSQADPDVDASVAYAYPTYLGHTVPAELLEVSNPNGFAADDILQGALGDCYFAATLAAITEVNPAYLNTLVAPLTDGFGNPVVDAQNYPLYKITMHYPNSAGVMTSWTLVTDAKLPSSAGHVAYASPSADGNMVKIGIPLLEKGFAALDQSEDFLTVVSQGGYSGLAGYVPVGDGGWATYAFTALVGDAGQTSQMASVSKAALMALVARHDTAAALDINNAYVNPPTTLPSGATLSLGSNGIYTYQPAHGGASFIIPNAHYYSLVSVAADGTTTLRNPWGGANDGQFSMPFSDLGPLFNRFTSAVLR